MSFVRNRELFREFIGADIFTCFPLFLSLLQRSHSPFQSALLPLLVSFCTVHDIFHGLNTNHVRVGILVTLVNVESSTSKNIAPFARRIATTAPTTTPSVHGYLLNNDLPLSLSLFFSFFSHSFALLFPSRRFCSKKCSFTGILPLLGSFTDAEVRRTRPFSK